MTTFAWAKMWIDTLYDPKMGTLDDHLWRRFFELMLLAKEYNDGGYLPSVRDIAWKLHATPEQLQTDLETLAEVKDDDQDRPLVILDGDQWFIPAFTKRQETAMESKERMRRLRERNKYLLPDCDDTVTDRHTEVEVEVEVEAEEEVERPASRTKPAVTDPEPPISNTPTIPPPATTPITQDDLDNPDPAFQEQWKQADDELAASIPRNVYEQKYAPLVPIRCDNGTAVLACGDQFVIDWHVALIQRFKARGGIPPPLLRTLSGIVGRTVDVKLMHIGAVF